MIVKSQLCIKNHTQIPHLYRKENLAIIHCKFEIITSIYSSWSANQ